jgi:hypothetical protein
MISILMFWTSSFAISRHFAKSRNSVDYLAEYCNISIFNKARNFTYTILLKWGARNILHKNLSSVSAKNVSERSAVNCDRPSLWIKPTDAFNFNFIVITILHVSGSLSAHHQEFLTVHRLWSQLHKVYQSRFTAKDSWWLVERLSETCSIIIPIKLEFNASVGFIHKESVKMHGHMIVKCDRPVSSDISLQEI